MAPVNLEVGYEVTLTASFTIGGPAPTGVPAITSNTPIWSVDNPALVNLAPSNDGLSCVVTGMMVGLATITVSAQGQTLLSETIQVTVTPNLADTVTIFPGLPHQ
jgi:hypothetical protein